MQPRAILCMTGSELTRGETRDSNGSFLATELTSLGVRVDEIVLVPDDGALLRAAVGRALSEADLVVLSGGLGPTQDDRTVEAIASLLERPILVDPETVERMKARARARGVGEVDLPSNFWKQAQVVEGAEVLSNPVGLAPGMILSLDGRLLVVLPGVPRELQAIVRESVLPAVRRSFGLVAPRILRAKILGVPESWAEARIQKLGLDFARTEYGISAKPGELLVKFLSHRLEDHAYLDEVRGLLASEFEDDLVVLAEGLLDSEGRPVATEQSAIVHALLLEARATVATAESCTGGLVAKHLTDHSGSSAYFLGAVVAYHDEAKASLLSVPRQQLATHGAVSAEVCEAMARGVRERLGAEYAISTTGVAGPDGGTPEKPVGLVYIGLVGPHAADSGDVLIERASFWGSRADIRARTSVRALDLLRRALERRRR